MSAASKKNDPFHFDEIYKQAGLEDLFVKKTMGELKQKPSAGPVPSSSPIRPAAATTAPRAPPNAVNFDLDFLTTIATSGAASPSLSKHSSASNLTASAVQQQNQVGPKSAGPSVKLLDDPFALFEEVPGAAAPQKHTTPTAPAVPAASGGGMLLDFDDVHASNLISPTAAPAALAQAQAAPPPPPQQPMRVAPSTGFQMEMPEQRPPPPNYSDHTEHQTAPPGSAAAIRPAPDADASGAGMSMASPPGALTRKDHPSGYAQFPSSSSSEAIDYRQHRATHGRDQPQSTPQHHQDALKYSQQYGYAVADGLEASQPSNSSSSFNWSHTPAGSGISGYLKAFGKKAVRAAKAGLAQLEHALEGLDHQQHSQGGTRPASAYGAGQGRSDAEVAEISNDEALAWAVRLADLPPHAQQQELSHMPPPLRRRVIEVLREQDVTSQGHHIGAPPQPPAYGEAVQHPAAPPRPAQPQPTPPPPPPPEATDLLGLGSGELPSNPSVAPAVAAAAPVVDDLLGFGDEATPPRTAPSAVPLPATQAPTATAMSNLSPPTSLSATAVAPAQPPPPPSAVHVDDIDDFFSGGKVAPAGPSSSGVGVAMHASSSAPNRVAPRTAGGGITIPAATNNKGSAGELADMLHGSDDEGGADVDVSGYADLYKGEQGSADEPEIRRRLRAQREAAKHAKMKAALAEKLAMEAEEAARREQQVTLKDRYKADIEAWKNKNKGNIRGLLGSLHTVLWPDSGWAPVSVGDLLEPGQVKRVYMRANLLVHPDKVRQRNGSAEQVAIADMVFDVLKDAWNVFR
ncbi:molecular chaperone [Volvox carteri f. nagariensis]|uniref:Molecular chaperone n=1 Tax=Volvox carteri f. nagariensis TaxID=3068 RepID=D8TPA1_VOLCA|nr:molecular chaperone [Volvox carteri f. nagariensis]EFJ50586.1 molecular chaperone [Volvox carteri f. nagariensis]|eukprot:XP_002948179.1 molecular chaperone [Volvox carteri f. nagariensis]